MGRVFNLILLAAMIVGAVVTYDMKHKAELAADRVADAAVRDRQGEGARSRCSRRSGAC